MAEVAVQDVAEYLSVTVGVCGEAAPGLHIVVVDDPQGAIVHALWVPVVCKAEVEAALKPPDGLGDMEGGCGSDNAAAAMREVGLSPPGQKPAGKALSNARLAGVGVPRNAPAGTLLMMLAGRVAISAVCRGEAGSLDWEERDRVAAARAKDR